VHRSRVLALGLALTPCLAHAASITGVSGTLVDGETIVVTGEGFGAQGPDVRLYDDFDGCSECASDATLGPGGADVGAWTRLANFPSYTDVDSHAGLSMLTSNYLPNSGGCPGPDGQGCESTSNYAVAAYEFTPAVTEVFWSFWRYLPADHTFPLESCDSINWKISWLYGTRAQHDNVINDWIVPVYNEAEHAQGYDISSIASNQGFTESNCGADLYPMYMVEPAATGTWVRYSVHVVGSSECAGTFRLWQIPFVTQEFGGYGCGDPRNTCEMLRKERTSIDTMVEPWHTISFNAYARNAENGCQATDVSVPRYDDIYVAAGPGAAARVEIASHATWGDPAHAAELDMSICPPTAWADGEVSCTVRPGSLPGDSTAYLFVVDADGTPSDQDPAQPGAQGFAIELGHAGTSDSGDHGGSTGDGGTNTGAADETSAGSSPGHDTAAPTDDTAASFGSPSSETTAAEAPESSGCGCTSNGPTTPFALLLLFTRRRAGARRV
jgi:hypothetical protein